MLEPGIRSPLPQPHGGQPIAKERLELRRIALAGGLDAAELVAQVGGNLSAGGAIFRACR